MQYHERPHKFRDPVHGFIYVSDLEKDIIDTAPFQRLRNIKQLAFTHYVFHGAEHTRFGHSLGVMHLATRAFQSAISKGTYEFSSNSTENSAIIVWLEQILRLVALTHDLGHAPFSHAAEDLFPVKSEIDGIKKYYKHEDLTELIILDAEISEGINKIGQLFTERYGLNFAITPKMICDIYKGELPGNNAIFTFMKTFMDSELDCDKMDYLLRDSFYCGVSYGKFDVERLIACLTIFKKKNSSSPFLGIESGGIQAFEEFVLARYFMFVQVYFHRTRRYFDLLLASVLKEILPNNTFPIDVSEYLKWDDVKVIQLLKDASLTNNKVKGIVDRKPWTCVYSTKTHPAKEGLVLFDTMTKSIKNSLNESLNKDTKPIIFREHFILDKSADKLPHKIIPRKHLIDEEETIAIVNKENNNPSTISDESHIISSLIEKINIQRIYADNEYAPTAKKIIDSLTVTQEEDDDNNE